MRSPRCCRIGRPANRALAAIALAEPYEPALLPDPVAVAPAILAQYTGRYELMPGYVVTLDLDGDRLMLTTPEDEPAEALAQSETRFYVPDHAALLRVRVTGSGPAEEIILAQGANGLRGRRVE